MVLVFFKTFLSLFFRCTLIYLNSVTSLPELMQFNPLTGKVVSSKQLSRSLVQACILHHTGEDHIKPILLVTEGLHVELEPAVASKHMVGKTHL
jgi:hypothetical protein